MRHVNHTDILRRRPVLERFRVPNNESVRYDEHLRQHKCATELCQRWWDLGQRRQLLQYADEFERKLHASSGRKLYATPKQ